MVLPSTAPEKVHGAVEVQALHKRAQWGVPRALRERDVIEEIEVGL
jgi:hypothetical protein